MVLSSQTPAEPSPQPSPEPSARPRRRPGRPPKPLADSSSAIAQLGALLRRLRTARGLTLMSLGELTGYSWQHLGAVERGQVVPSEEVIVACERALTAGGHLIARFPAVVREQAHERHGREAARRAETWRPDPHVDWVKLTAAIRRPSRVSEAIVAELEQITDRQRTLYHELASAEMLVSVEAHLGLLTSLMEGAQAEPIRHRIASAAAEAAGFTAWLWFDLGDQYKMRVFYEMAAELLVESANPSLRSYVTGYRALAAEASGRYKEAVRYAETARRLASARTSHLTRSWLCAIGAKIAPLTGDRAGALELLDQAGEHFARAEGKEEWMYEFDQTALAGYRGQCNLRVGRPKEAAMAFKAVLASRPPACDRRRARLTLGLAEARLALGHPDAALESASDVLTLFAKRGSVSGLRRVRRFQSLLVVAGYRREAEVLDEQVRAHLGSAV
ncbi:MAG: helix-turn-helix domain-containing protein [Actinomadura sp.]